MALTAVALVVAVAGPYEVVVFGLLVAGVAHVALELRYVYGRYGTVFTSGVRAAVHASLILIVAMRLSGTGRFRSAEVLVVLVMCTTAVVVVAVRSRTRSSAGGLIVLGGALAVWALAHIDTWFVVQAHLHNLLPLVFLWSWSNELATRTRRQVRAACVLWAVAVPAALLALPTAALAASPRTGTLSVLDRNSVLGSVAGSSLDGVLAERLVVLFAFTQVVHYGIWCWYLPRHAPSVTTAFEATPAGRVLRGRRLWALAAAITLVVLALSWIEYRHGRTFYGALGAYHAYLEYPVIALIAVAWFTRRSNLR